MKFFVIAAVAAIAASVSGESFDAVIQDVGITPFCYRAPGKLGDKVTTFKTGDHVKISCSYTREFTFRGKLRKTHYLKTEKEGCYIYRSVAKLPTEDVPKC
ncbi:hypothetical protein GGI12_004513 [Dipsacomyces acuminosporus]|nr:hypothetical protein GGI12_004513 [Dipsacomyces acuminosporus]